MKTQLEKIEAIVSAMWKQALLLGWLILGWLSSSASFATELAAAGPYSAGWSSVSVPRTGGGSFTAQLFYPAVSPGNNAVFDPSGGSYPAISFGHGFLSPVSWYQSTLEHLATWGYFVIAPTTQSGFAPSHAAFATELLESLEHVVSLNDMPQSPFFGSVATERLGLSGHSMGGGASMLAAAQAASDTRLKAVANLAAAETNPSAIAAMPSIQVPVSLISGSNDTITPLPNHGLPMYQQGRAPIQLPILEGVTHTGFTDLAGDDQRAKSRAALTSFFNFYLQEDQSLWRQVWGPEQPSFLTANSQFASGISVIAAESTVAAAAGSRATFDLAIQNVGSQPSAYDLLVEDAVWNHSLSASQTPTLQPGETFEFTLEVDMPRKLGANTLDEILVSARSQLDGLTRDYVALVAVAERPTGLDPLPIGPAGTNGGSPIQAIVVPEPATTKMLVLFLFLMRPRALRIQGTCE